MIGVFTVDNPDSVELTLTLTADLKEWKKVSQAFNEIELEYHATLKAIRDIIMAATSKVESTLYPT